MVRVEGTVVINRPVEEVFAFLTDPDKPSQWQGMVLETEQTSEGPVGVGTTGNLVSQFLGRRMESSWEITEYELNKKVTLGTRSGPISFMNSATLEPVDEGVKVTLVAEYEVGGYFKLAEPILARMAQRQADTDYANLKDLMEAQPEGSA